MQVQHEIVYCGVNDDDETLPTTIMINLSSLKPDGNLRLLQLNRNLKYLGVGFIEECKRFVRPPSGICLVRQHSRDLREAHFITSSERSVSEPNCAGQAENDTE